MISHIYFTDSGLLRYLIRRTAGGFVVGLFVWPAVRFVRQRLGR